MKKLIFLISLCICNISNAQNQTSVDEIMEAYLFELKYKVEVMDQINEKMNSLSGKANEQKARVEFSKLMCERRQAMRSYIYSLNKVLDSKEIKAIEDSKEVKDTLEKQKENYLITIYKEDETLQRGVFGRNTKGIESYTYDKLCGLDTIEGY